MVARGDLGNEAPLDMLPIYQKEMIRMAREAGKPENLLDRIAESSLQKFYKDSTLLQQDYVKDPKKTIEQFLKESDKELEVVSFKRVSLTVQ